MFLVYVCHNQKHKHKAILPLLRTVCLQHDMAAAAWEILLWMQYRRYLQIVPLVACVHLSL